MRVQRLDQYCIRTTDLDKTLHFFYTDVIGFVSGPRPPFTFPGCWLYNGEGPSGAALELKVPTAEAPSAQAAT